MNQERTSRLAWGICGVLVAVTSAATSAIGIVTGKGRFFVNQAPVTGQATLVEGAVIETQVASSDLRLPDGTHVRLGALSRGRVHRDRFVLERGEGQVTRGSEYRLEAAGFWIVSRGTARVRIEDKGGIQVAALSGPVQVARAHGPLLATLPPGLALHFEIQAAAASPPYLVTGCVGESNGRYYLQDPALGLNLALEGENLKEHVGQRVEVQGVSAKPDGSVGGPVRVVRVTRIAGTCPAPASAAPGSRDSAARAGMSGTKKAIIAGVIVAGAAAGAAVALEEPEEQPGTISR